MPFDPFTWAIGFTLSKSAGWISDALLKKTLSKEMNRVVERWADALPPEASVHPGALFPDIYADDELVNRPALAAVRTKLQEKTIPSATEWNAALLEQWRQRRRSLGTRAQSFFQLSEADAAPNLSELAELIHRVCIDDELLFKGTVIAQLDEITSSTDRASGRNLPDPISGPTDIRTVALTIESKTGSRIHVILFDSSSGILFIWGNFVGKTINDVRWTFLCVVRLVCQLPNIRKVVLGVSDIADLANSDGTGPVAVLRINFLSSHLQQIASTSTVPVDFWESIDASLVAHQNTPFETWKNIPFRDLEELES